MNLHLKDMLGVDLIEENVAEGIANIINPYLTHVASSWLAHSNWHRKLGHALNI